MLASLAVAVSCREPTQITVVIKTGEKCADLSGVEIVVGADQQATQARFEQQFTAAVTHDCDANGLVGTLVVTPGGTGGTIVVAAGVRVGGMPAPDPASCALPANVKSCIIARRSFSFLDHTSLTLPVELDPLCVGQACDPASTCFKGSCVDASVTCNDSACGLPQEHPGTGTGSGNEAGSSDGAYDADLDGMSFEDVVDSGNGGDATMVTDARADADSGDSGPTGTLCANQSGFSAYCAPSNGNGDTTPGGCGGGPGDCCRCKCTMTAGFVNCTVSTRIGASCAGPCQ
ncbi:MAG: Xanthine/uracil/thiamine/ascorbate permease family protein [Myxococcaceae bacterium]|nr:Xanthine/uracil/thiamine/ascorbate permease family protein [Myxococcaceae bacterium]MEA2752837.1 hypothetical protein [Myxococcales bacterium]